MILKQDNPHLLKLENLIDKAIVITDEVVTKSKYLTQNHSQIIFTKKSVKSFKD